MVTVAQVTVPAAGTPVALSATRSPANRVTIEALSTNTGKLYVGLVGLNSVTFANAFNDGLVAGTVYTLAIEGTGNPIDLSDLYVDVDAGHNNEGCIVTAISY